MRMLVALAVVVAAVGIGVWLLIPETRFVYGLAPIARGEAVLLTRRNEAHDTKMWAQLVRSDGTVVWSANTDRLATIEALGFSGVAATADRVLLLGTRGGATLVRALDRERGKLIWETQIADGVPLWIGPMLHVDGSRAYAIHGVHGKLTALALADGAVVWTGDEALGADASIREVVVLAPDRLMVATREAAPVLLDGTTGAVLRTLPMRRFACTTPDAILGTDDDGLVRLPFGADVAEPRRVRLDDGLRASLDDPCGTREGDVVIAAEDDDRSVLVRIDPSGAARWSVPIPAGLRARHVSADGRMPRFLPLVVSIDGPTHRTVIADLDAGTIVSQHEHADDRMTFVTEARAFILAIFDGTVFAVDPGDGSLERATRFTNTWGNEAVAQDYRFGELWLVGTDWGRPKAVGWAVMGLDTGEVRVNGTVQSTDVTAAGWSPG